MEVLLEAVVNKQNVIFTSLGGIERSRFLLRSELLLLSKLKTRALFKRIFHLVTWDADVTRIYAEANLLSFDDLVLKVAKLYGSESDENKSDTPDVLQAANVIVCPTKYVLDNQESVKYQLTREDSLVVFDGIPLESIEGTCCEISERNAEKVVGPDNEFSLLNQSCWSIILACNRPFDGIEPEWGCPFPIVIDQDLSQRNYRIFSSIITKGFNGMPLSFLGEKQEGIHDEVGKILEKCSKTIKTGGIVVFLQSYGKMIEYHNHWQKSGLFERIGLPYARENRGEGQLKRMLINFSTTCEKQIVLISHRFHQDIHFADCALSSSARVIISVGLPYPFTNDTWDARISRNDQACISEPALLNGSQLFRYRGLEFMNRVARRCLEEFRSQDCAFFILDKSIANDRARLTQEMAAEVQVEEASVAMKRFERYCQAI